MSWLSGALLLAALLFFGVLTGGLVATRVIGTSGMGWDRLADTLGGVLAGGALGLVAGIVGVLKVGSSGRFWLAGSAVVGCLGAAAYLLATQPRVRTATVTSIPPPPVESFSLHMGVADGLAGPPSEGNRLPWNFLRIASNLSLDYVPAGNPSRHCAANGIIDSSDDIAALTALRGNLARLPTEFDCGEQCPSCMEVSLEWFLDQTRRTAALTDRCWRSHPQLQPLRASVERLFATYGPKAECTPSAP
jgi:hypothetical protein